MDYLKEWNRLHIKYIHKYGPKIRNEKMADFCEKVILEAKEIYYNKGYEIMTDNEYDSFEEKLRILRPNSKVLQKVGY